MKRALLSLSIVTSFLLVTWFCAAQEKNGNPSGGKGQTKKAASGTEMAAKCRGSYIGSRSCSSTSCHGSVTADSDKSQIGRNEFLIWLEGNDPHRYAHRGLTNKLARRIFTKLGVMKDGKPAPGKQDEYRSVFQRCAACHNPLSTDPPKPTTASHGVALVAGWLRDGVSCEACHGPAKEWVSRHYKNDFQSLSAKKKCDSGMTDTANMFVRAKMCASCHVGSQDRHVDHDLIAAGHPALKFEFVAYQAILPKHWRIGRDRKRQGNSKDFALNNWVTGQLAATSAALELLEHRAKGGKDTVWPELSETDCYACHHDLGEQAWRQEYSVIGEKKNRVRSPWSSWQMGIIDDVLYDLAGGNDVVAQVSRIRNMMQVGLLPRRQEIAALATKAVAGMNGLVDRLGVADGKVAAKAADVKSTLADLARQRTAVKSWERATQIYLGLRAVDDDHRYAGKLTGQQKQLHETLNKVRDLLAFPTDKDGGYDSPREFAGKVLGKNSRREAVRAALDKAGNLLKMMYP